MLAPQFNFEMDDNQYRTNTYLDFKATFSYSPNKWISIPIDISYRKRSSSTLDSNTDTVRARYSYGDIFIFPHLFGVLSSHWLFAAGGVGWRNDFSVEAKTDFPSGSPDPTVSQKYSTAFFIDILAGARLGFFTPSIYYRNMTNSAGNGHTLGLNTSFALLRNWLLLNAQYAFSWNPVTTAGKATLQQVQVFEAGMVVAPHWPLRSIDFSDRANLSSALNRRPS